MLIDSIVWLVLLIVFAVGEAVTVGLTSIWFAAGALGALITSTLTENLLIQIIVFLALSFVTLLLVRPLARKYFIPRRVATNADRILGQEGIVTEDIDNLEAKGQVKVSGTVWSARSQRDEVPIPAGTRVRILRIEGVKVFVAPAEVPSGAEP
ncbi:MAG TPA: NfeD family protein [Candidatus Galloscillospira excrementavium]|nr:NfeD family protein [Candidatus Galloscillospira excrementavium]